MLSEYWPPYFQGPACKGLLYGTMNKQQSIAFTKRMPLPGIRQWQGLRWVTLQQTHGIQVQGIVDQEAGTVLTGDALWTQCRHTVLCLRTADCLPVVLADNNSHIVGIAHAGWRGLQAGVLPALYQAMFSVYPATQWQAWVGPAISQAAFEVGQDVVDAFTKGNPSLSKFFKFGKTSGKYYADLPAIAQTQLQALGVQRITLSGICTYEQVDTCFSYRRHQDTGRLITVATLADGLSSTRRL